MDNFIELITKESITFTLALLGSLGTLISGVFHLFNNRKKLIFEINSFFLHDTFLQVHFTLINKSSLSIVITSVSFKYNETYYPCPKISEVIQETTSTSYPNIIREISTINFPINLCPYTGTSGFLSFPFHAKIDIDVSTPKIFVISSNRGRELEIECKFPDMMSEAF